jgi:hypothetical protein
MPALCRWVEWAHGASARLLFGNHELWSRAGVQQGGPLGPLLFSLAIHPVALELAQRGNNGNPSVALDACSFYLDDGAFRGSVDAAAQALVILLNRCPELGLSLNIGKCELIVSTGTETARLAEAFPSRLLIDPDTGLSRVSTCGNFEFLGAAVRSFAFCSAHTRERVRKSQPLLTSPSTLHRFLQTGVQL